MAAIRSFQNQLFKISAEKGYWLKPLGELNGVVNGKKFSYITWLGRSRPASDHNDPKILIVAGTHGEEIAGPWGLLKWLQDSSDKWAKKIDISFIPIVNPYGFARNQRYGPSGESTNCGFCTPKSPVLTENPELLAKYEDHPSPEGQILANNIDLLLSLSTDGFLSLHEDVSVEECYLYAYEHTDKPSRWVRAMREELNKHFPKSFTGTACVDTSKNTSGPPCKNGLVYNFLDGSFESWMLELGVRRCAVPETPGKYPLRKRVVATESVINRFVSLAVYQRKSIPIEGRE